MKKILVLLFVATMLQGFWTKPQRVFVGHVHVRNTEVEQNIVWLIHAKDHTEAKKIFNYCVKKKYPKYNWMLDTYMVYEASNKEYFNITDIK